MMQRAGSLVLLLALVVVLAATAACSHTIPLGGVTVDRPPTAVQAPVALGVYYSPEFRAHEAKIWRMGDRWDFALGEASVKLLDRVWPYMVESVLPLPSRPPVPADRKVAGVIEPKIDSFDFGLPFLKTGTYTAEITYRMTLYSPDGASLASWAVRGEGAKPGQVGFEFARWPGQAADLAMQDAARRLMAEFRDIPEVRAWLRGAGVRDSSSRPAWRPLVAGRER
jgi:hypothetical protein